MIKFDKNANNVIKTINKSQELGFEKAAILVHASAVQKCPVDTGRLRASINYEATEEFAAVGTNVEYGISIEFGHSRKAPQGFIRPAMLENKKKIEEILQATIKTELEKGDVNAGNQKDNI